MRVEPVVLQGTQVRLEPLTPEHHEALWEVARDPVLWRWSTTSVASSDDFRRYFETALAEKDEGRSLPFTTIEQASGRAVGSTRFGNIEPAHRRVEIGWTWIGRAWQRTGINTEAKFLMLRHAFETWGCLRVELRTNALNRQSREAILRIGAKEEGILRKHMVSELGERRDTAYHSILDDEWPEGKARLESLMRRAPG